MLGLPAASRRFARRPGRCSSIKARHVQPLGHLGATRPAHDEGLEARQVALFACRESARTEAEAMARPEHAVAQELQALIRSGALPTQEE